MAAKLQFSLRALLAAVVAAGLLAAEAAVFSAQTALIVGNIVAVLSPAALAAGIAYTHAFTRAFCIGTLASLLATRLLEVPLSHTYSFFFKGWPVTVYMGDNRIEVCLSWIIALAGGLVAILVRWLSVTNSPDKLE
jgi:hypothetical protein